MFQQITLLCLGAILNAAHDYEYSPTWDRSIKNGISSRYNTSKQYFSGDVIQYGLHAQNRDMQLRDSARSYADTWSSRNYENSQEYSLSKMSIAYPRKREVNEQRKPDNPRRKLKSKVAKYIGRGLIKNLMESVKQKGIVGGLEDAVKHTIDKTLEVVNGTAQITEDLFKGSAQIATDAVKESAKLTEDVVGGTLNITKKAFGWAVNKTIQVGKLIVQAPLHSIELTINAAWALHTFGAGLTAQMVSDTADWFQGNWNAVKAIEFPGKHLIVMLYPSGLMSIVNRLTKEIMYMLDEGHKMLTHAFAYTLYVSLKIVFYTVNKVIALGHLDCIKLIPQIIKVDKMLLSAIHTESGKACGISHLKPANNVTITRNDEKFLIVETSWILEDIFVHLTGVQVTGGNETLLDNEVMDTTIKKIKATGTVSFEAGTLLRFARLDIKVDDMQELKVKFSTSHKSYLMEYIETLSGFFQGLVRNEINHALTVLEDQVFNHIANI